MNTAKSGRGWKQRIRTVIDGYLEGAIRPANIAPIGDTTIGTLTVTGAKEEMHVYIGATELRERMVKRAMDALLDGNSVTINSVKLWLDYDPFFNRQKKGSDAYDWDETGNKIRCRVILYQQNPKQELPSHTTVGYRFIAWSKVWE